MKTYLLATIQPPADDFNEANRWINQQHTGKPLVPFKAKVSAAHRDAAFQLHRLPRLRVEMELDKWGNWKALKIVP